ncbi:hypothetical protein [Acidaminococcus fermentans]|nr:hypothetical protein [Acidaminococcus fermentans]
MSNKNNDGKIFIIITILVIVFFIYLFTLPKGHWLIGLWNSFISGRY